MTGPTTNDSPKLLKEYYAKLLDHGPDPNALEKVDVDSSQTKLKQGVTQFQFISRTVSLNLKLKLPQVMNNDTAKKNSH